MASIASRCVLAIAGTGVLLLGQPATCFAQKATGRSVLPRYEYDTPGVRLEGRLIERKVYGPPGYGETPAKDERDTILILRLRRVITVRPLPDAKAKNSASLGTARNIREVQLFVNRTKSDQAHQMAGKAVVAEGTLNEAVAPIQYTRVWLDTKTLSLK